MKNTENSFAEKKLLRIKNIAVVLSFALIIAGFGIATALAEDKGISYSERRKLESLPEFSYSSITDGSFFEKFESYSLDNFVARDAFRSLKAFTSKYVMCRLDNNGIYVYKNGVYKIETLNEESVVRAAEKIEAAIEYLGLSELNTYYSVIPDKNSLIGGESGRPYTKFGEVEELLLTHLTTPEYIDIASILRTDDYYSTDLHWRQEKIKGVANKLLFSMGNNYNAMQDSFGKKTLNGFYGAYYGQAALNVLPDRMVYLTNDTIATATAFDAITGEEILLYDEAEFETIDPYDLFIGGARAIINIKNPLSNSGKTLYIFRDSFASSLAPLMLGGYSEIVLIDLRYISSQSVSKYVSFQEDGDVLFLYSTLILNNSASLR